MKFFRRGSNWGMLLLAIWLIAQGILALVTDLKVPYQGVILAVLAILAGVCLLLGK